MSDLRTTLQKVIDEIRPAAERTPGNGFRLVCLQTCQNIVDLYTTDKDIRRLCRKHRSAVEEVVRDKDVLRKLLGEINTEN